MGFGLLAKNNYALFFFVCCRGTGSSLLIGEASWELGCRFKVSWWRLLSQGPRTMALLDQRHLMGDVTVTKVSDPK